ncbi:unnamed protein product [Rotaria magnacalcarata]
MINDYTSVAISILSFNQLVLMYENRLNTESNDHFKRLQTKLTLFSFQPDKYNDVANVFKLVLLLKIVFRQVVQFHFFINFGVC